MICPVCGRELRIVHRLDADDHVMTVNYSCKKPCKFHKSVTPKHQKVE